MTDIKHTLRKFEFPQCAKEALVKIEQLLTGRITPSNKQVDLAMDIISEFMFLESDRRSGWRSAGLNPLQELQLIDVVCDYLSGNMNEIAKNTIFLSLFGGTDTQRRMKVLCTLASMAVSASNTPMLLAVGTWLQQTGCSSPLSLQLAESLVRDHFFLQTSNRAALNSLATQAPQFLANFMAAVTELYLHDGHEIKLPSKNLLEVITNWVYSNSSLCMSAQLIPPTLPSGAIPMAAVTPLAGLIHWCSVAPLCYTKADVEIDELAPAPVKKIKLEEDNASIKEACPNTLGEVELYKKLHVGVLNSLRAGRRTHGAATAVSAQQLAALVPIVQAYAQQLVGKGIKLATHSQLQDCLDRIAQATQVALANGCVYGNISNLLTSFGSLPQNRLLRIVIKAHQQAM